MAFMSATVAAIMVIIGVTIAATATLVTDTTDIVTTGATIVAIDMVDTAAIPIDLTVRTLRTELPGPIRILPRDNPAGMRHRRTPTRMAGRH